jgi:hypothetical protein
LFNFLGGTADITVHEKLEGTKLRELCKASGDVVKLTLPDVVGLMFLFIASNSLKRSM